MSNDYPTQAAEKRDLVVTRVFDAPVEQVWKAWSDPEYVMQWWGPEGFTSPLARMDFREGGTSLVCMRSPEYGDQYNIWTYRKIVPTERIEYISNLADKDGNKADPVKMGMPPDFPQGSASHRHLQRGGWQNGNDRYRTRLGGGPDDGDVQSGS